jgi:hypothetical protein
MKLTGIESFKQMVKIEEAEGFRNIGIKVLYAHRSLKLTTSLLESIISARQMMTRREDNMVK